MLRYDQIGTEDEHGLTITTESFLAHCKEASNAYLDDMLEAMKDHHGPVIKRIDAL